MDNFHTRHAPYTDPRRSHLNAYQSWEFSVMGRSAREIRFSEKKTHLDQWVNTITSKYCDILSNTTCDSSPNPRGITDVVHVVNISFLFTSFMWCTRTLLVCCQLVWLNHGPTVDGWSDSPKMENLKLLNPCLWKEDWWNTNFNGSV